MESAPATIPATREVTFNPALAPMSVGTDNHSSASARSPAFWASFMIGTKPAVDPRFGSSHEADTAREL